MKNSDEIEGWFDFHDVYAMFADINDGGPVAIAEIGAWKGKSTAFLCDIVPKGSSITVIDTWAGTPGETDTAHSEALETDMFEVFRENMGDRVYDAVREDSSRAADRFADLSFDAVFIDAEHSKSAVLRDATAWFPKVRPGGWIGGHDYSEYWPGVIVAVKEFFQNRGVFNVVGQSWIYQKPEPK